MSKSALKKSEEINSTSPTSSTFPSPSEIINPKLKPPTLKFIKLHLRTFAYIKRAGQLKLLHLYLLLLFYRNTFSNKCTPPYKEIEALLDIKSQWLRRQVKTLEKFGLIILEDIKGEECVFFPLEELIEKRTQTEVGLTHKTPTSDYMQEFIRTTTLNPNTFVKVHFSILQDLILTKKPLIVPIYYRLLLHKNLTTEYCFPAIRTLKEETGLSLDTLNTHLKLLAELNFISKSRGSKISNSTNYSFPKQRDLERKEKEERDARREARKEGKIVKFKNNKPKTSN